MVDRRKTKTVIVGNVPIGSSCPIVIQAMTKTHTKLVSSTVKQINSLVKCGARLVRLAVNDIQDAKAIRAIKKRINIPIIADIHFSYQLALEAINSGVDKIRINPGNIYKENEIREVVKCAKDAKIPIRIGINSGSLRNVSINSGAKFDKEDSQSSVNQEAINMVRSCLEFIKLFESMYFYDIVISLKSSDVPSTIYAYSQMAKYCNYPFHLGVTATGPSYSGVIKSSIGIGTLLSMGIGDTIRISLTSSPEEEVMISKKILESLNLANPSFEIISCPVCGRCQVDLFKVVAQLQRKLYSKGFLSNGKSFQLAVMGCMVNGPGEAKKCDLGVAFGKGKAALFKKGKIIRQISEDKVIPVLLKMLEADK